VIEISISKFVLFAYSDYRQIVRKMKTKSAGRLQSQKNRQERQEMESKKIENMAVLVPISSAPWRTWQFKKSDFAILLTKSKEDLTALAK